MIFNGASGRKPQTEARRYVYGVLATILNQERGEDGWFALGPDADESGSSSAQEGARCSARRDDRIAELRKLSKHALSIQDVRRFLRLTDTVEIELARAVLAMADFVERAQLPGGVGT